MDNGSKSKKKVDWEKVRHGLKVFADILIVIVTAGPKNSASNNSSKG